MFAWSRRGVITEPLWIRFGNTTDLTLSNRGDALVFERGSHRAASELQRNRHGVGAKPSCTRWKAAKELSLSHSGSIINPLQNRHGATSDPARNYEGAAVESPRGQPSAVVDPPQSRHRT